MTKEKFAEELRNRLPEYMPDRYKNLTFSEKKTNKNNGIELTGILVDGIYHVLKSSHIISEIYRKDNDLVNT